MIRHSAYPGGSGKTCFHFHHHYELFMADGHHNFFVSINLCCFYPSFSNIFHHFILPFVFAFSFDLFSVSCCLFGCYFDQSVTLSYSFDQSVTFLHVQTAPTSKLLLIFNLCSFSEDFFPDFVFSVNTNILSFYNSLYQFCQSKFSE